MLHCRNKTGPDVLGRMVDIDSRAPVSLLPLNPSRLMCVRYELAALCASLTEAQDFDASNLPVDHWIKHFYNAHVALELHHSDRALELSVPQCPSCSCFPRGVDATCLRRYHELDQLYPGMGCV